ncbi:fibronectin type III domain protein [Calothrix sp. NIES-4101]|nr:fibronectin type III domain protein [Calothrix sp. NIES-4101]
MLDKFHSASKALIATQLLLGLTTVAIQSPVMASDVNLCPADRPCFNESYQSTDKVIFRFDGIKNWDFYNVRYRVRGGEKQVENRSGSFTFKNVRPNSRYTIKVQGCNSRFLGHSTCSEWSEKSVDTR